MGRVTVGAQAELLREHGRASGSSEHFGFYLEPQMEVVEDS